MVMLGDKDSCGVASVDSMATHLHDGGWMVYRNRGLRVADTQGD